MFTVIKMTFLTGLIIVELKMVGVEVFDYSTMRRRRDYIHKRGLISLNIGQVAVDNTIYTYLIGTCRTWGLRVRFCFRRSVRERRDNVGSLGAWEPESLRASETKKGKVEELVLIFRLQLSNQSWVCLLVLVKDCC